MSKRLSSYFVAQELINKVKSKCCGIKVYLIITIFSFAISIPLGLTLSFLFIMYQILKRGSGTGGANRNPPTYLD